MRIPNRFAVAIVLAIATACTCAIIGITALRALNTVQKSSTETLLRSEATNRSEQVQAYLDLVADDLHIAASTRIVREGIVQFDNAFAALGDNATQILQRLYISDNPNPIGNKQALLRARDDSDFSAVHERYHEWLSALAHAHNHYDVFLVTARGDVVYTSYKEIDFATNLLTGNGQNTELGKSFRRIRNAPDQESINFGDFAHYAPSGGRPAAFIGTSVRHEERFVGVLMVQLKSQRLSELIRPPQPLGKSGEVFLVGPDRLMRTQSRFETENTVLRTRIDTPNAEAALARTAGVIETLGYHGERVISAYAPLTWGEATWAVVAEMSVEEVQAPVRALRNKLLGFGTLLTLVAFGLGWLLGDKDAGP